MLATLDSVGMTIRGKGKHVKSYMKTVQSFIRKIMCILRLVNIEIFCSLLNFDITYFVINKN